MVNAHRNPWNLFQGEFVKDFSGSHKTTNKPRVQPEVENQNGFVTICIEFMRTLMTSGASALEQTVAPKQTA